jgi:import inner membrane translocase subunit TIM17
MISNPYGACTCAAWLAPHAPPKQPSHVCVAWFLQEDPFNAIMAGALTGGFLQLRSGLRPAFNSAVMGGVLLVRRESPCGHLWAVGSKQALLPGRTKLAHTPEVTVSVTSQQGSASSRGLEPPMR